MKPELAKVGSSWDGSDLEKWPGVAGIAGETNHLAHNDNPFLPDPENTNSTRENTMTGGKSKFVEMDQIRLMEQNIDADNKDAMN